MDEHGVLAVLGYRVLLKLPWAFTAIAISMWMLRTGANITPVLVSSKKASRRLQKNDRKAATRSISVVGSDEKRRCWSCGVWRYLHFCKHAHQSSHWYYCTTLPRFLPMGGKGRHSNSSPTTANMRTSRRQLLRVQMAVDSYLWP